jgi:hypothetical protein
VSRFNIIVRSFSGYCLSRNVERRIHDFASRPARGFADGEEFSMGGRRMKWLYTPHVPRLGLRRSVRSIHRDLAVWGPVHTTWREHPPVTETEVLTASEGMRGMMDYYAHARSTSAILERLATLLACQHGSAFRGNSAALLRELAATIERGNGKVSALPSAMTA